MVQMSGIGLSTRKFHLKIPLFKTSHCIREEMCFELNQKPTVEFHTK